MENFEQRRGGLSRSVFGGGAIDTARWVREGPVGKCC